MRAAVDRVVDRVAVVIRVARIAFAVLVQVGLRRVEQGLAVVEGVRDAVAVQVVVAHITERVEIEVLLSRVGDLRAIVQAVLDAVAVLVPFDAVRDLVAVRVREPFVGETVAVVVHPVAGLGHARVRLGVERLAVVRVGGLVVVVVSVDAVGDLVKVGIDEALVNEGVAVVIGAVACLGRTRVHRRVIGGAVGLVRVEVRVVVQVAGVPGTVEVEVLLVGVAHVGAVVLVVLDAVAVLVRLEAVRRTVIVRVGEALIGRPVAVVIFAVAGLLLRFLGIACQNPVAALFGPEAHAVLVGIEALVPARVLVDLAVAVVVGSVAFLLRRAHGGAGRQSAHRAAPQSLAMPPLVLDEASGRSTFVDGKLGAGALLPVQDAERPLGTGGIDRVLAGISRGAGGILRTDSAAEAP